MDSVGRDALGESHFQAEDGVGPLALFYVRVRFRHLTASKRGG